MYTLKPTQVLAIISLTAGLMLLVATVQAQEGAPPDASELQQEWEALPEEERARVREEMRQGREAEDPDKRDALREEADRRWPEMTPEQRQRVQEELQGGATTRGS